MGKVQMAPLSNVAPPSKANVIEVRKSDWEDQSDCEVEDADEKDEEQLEMDMFAGRTYSKKTKPDPVKASKKRKAEETVTRPIEHEGVCP